MNFFIIFQSSGDTIPLTTDKPDLLDYYIDFLESTSSNQFSLISNLKVSNLTQLYQTLQSFNTSIPGKLISFKQPDDATDFLNQDLINKLHCEWVHSNHKKFLTKDLKKKYPDILQPLFDQISDDIHDVIFSEIVYKFNMQEIYFAINQELHLVESMFNKINFQAKFDDKWGWIETQNIFPKNYTSNSQANLSLKFNHYGRTLYHKFCTFDLDLNHDDENTFDQLLGYVQLSLVPPETINYSPEYLQWCTKIGREPGGNNLNLGNIIDLDKKLLEYRKLLYKNLMINNNYFQLSLYKG